MTLNGPWDFAVTDSKELPDVYDKTIIVPFAPETKLSGIGQMTRGDSYLHYRRTIEIPDRYVGKTGILRFSAVDQEADVYIDGRLEKSHSLGYFPFHIKIPCLKKTHVIQVVAHDDTDSPIFARGKQSNNPDGIWYTATSGIWQSVFIEFVPSDGYINHLHLTPDFDNQTVKIVSSIKGAVRSMAITVFLGGRIVLETTLEGFGGEIDLHGHFAPWSPEEPNVYSVLIKMGEDVVRSRFIFCKIERRTVKGSQYIFVNGRPRLIKAVLDQGYYPESGMTPPSYEAYVADLKTVKDAGFNAIRKHIKIEPRVWYALCEDLGLFVIQDMVNGGSVYGKRVYAANFVKPFKGDHNVKALGRALEESRAQFCKEMEEAVYCLFNCHAIIIWTLFNEGWGQFDAKQMTEKLRILDSTRLIDSTSGWFDQHAGDFNSQHIYFTKIKIKEDKARISALSEFGGYTLRIDGHVWSMKEFGYEKFLSIASLENAVFDLFETKIKYLISNSSLCYYVFTQLSDVETETNGLITYDRKVRKIDCARFKAVQDDLEKEFREVFNEKASVTTK